MNFVSTYFDAKKKGAFRIQFQGSPRSTGKLCNECLPSGCDESFFNQLADNQSHCRSGQTEITCYLRSGKHSLFFQEPQNTSLIYVAEKSRSRHWPFRKSTRICRKSSPSPRRQRAAEIITSPFELARQSLPSRKQAW